MHAEFCILTLTCIHSHTFAGKSCRSEWSERLNQCRELEKHMTCIQGERRDAVPVLCTCTGFAETLFAIYVRHVRATIGSVYTLCT